MFATRSSTKTLIGPHHHGRKMTLKAFEFAQVEDGYLVELARGYIVVSEGVEYFHSMRTATICGHLGHYHVEHPGALHVIAGPADCKLLIPDWESERHPDI